MREEYATIEPILTRLAAQESARLDAVGMLSSDGELYLVYVPQLGFLLKLPMPPLDEEQWAEANAAYEQRAGLAVSLPPNTAPHHLLQDAHQLPSHKQGGSITHKKHARDKSHTKRVISSPFLGGATCSPGNSTGP